MGTFSTLVRLISEPGLAQKQFLPLMNTDDTDKERSKFAGRYKHKAVGFDQSYQYESALGKIHG
jgi:hypothetical protein